MDINLTIIYNTYILSLGVAYPSDVVWKDLSKYLNYAMSPSALHLFVKANRGGVINIIGLYIDQEPEPTKNEELLTNECMYNIHFFQFKIYKNPSLSHQVMLYE